MEGLNSLSKLLDTQVKIQIQILELETKKTKILVNGTTEELDKIVNLEQPLIMNSNNIEKQREDLQSKIGIKGASLKQIINMYPNYNGNSFEKYFQQLSDVTTKIKKVNSTNQKILNTRLDVINYCLLQTGLQQQESITYKKR